MNKVREEYRIVKTENEFLKEKNDTLFKLGKVALENTEKVPEVEVLADEDDSGLDVLINSVMENKSHRFVRGNPATYAEKTKAKEAPVPKPKAPQHSKPETSSTETRTETRSENKDVKEKINYCHFFSNFGYCKFERENNRKCKFSHTKAPTCAFDGRCNRKKCMFSHTKAQVPQTTNQGNPSITPQPFLGSGQQRTTSLQQQMNALMQQVQQMQQMQYQPMWENVRHW